MNYFLAEDDSPYSLFPSYPGLGSYERTWRKHENDEQKQKESTNIREKLEKYKAHKRGTEEKNGQRQQIKQQEENLAILQKNWPWDERKAIDTFLVVNNYFVCITECDEMETQIHRAWNWIGFGELGELLFYEFHIAIVYLFRTFLVTQKKKNKNKKILQYTNYVRFIGKRLHAREYCILCDMELVIPQMLVGSPQDAIHPRSLWTNLQG
ncbi:hypothetical protein RFI_23112 [Reticulomyxa filosa]|uniref:Uncharacterized protein n=1 Tax=Reticulomyxa filosa TaxID=46433 RepID=X6MKT9_RETFI|nr:hypothetical protein RFI_23112 [Reticulomyxa filosa]|eukprot:ETO14256.1 hypothetical protein RFI_23112 [Reticulomyxa filosa]